jgi:hypothetical protein
MKEKNEFVGAEKQILSVKIRTHTSCGEKQPI